MSGGGYVAYSVSQLAAELGISSQGVRQAIKHKRLPQGVATGKVGNQLVIYVPVGTKIARGIGNQIPTNKHPGHAVTWRLMAEKTVRDVAAMTGASPADVRAAIKHNRLPPEVISGVGADGHYVIYMPPDRELRLQDGAWDLIRVPS